MSRAYWTSIPPHDLRALTAKQYEAVALIIHGATQREAAHLAGCSRNSIVKRLEAAHATIERNWRQSSMTDEIKPGWVEIYAPAHAELQRKAAAFDAIRAVPRNDVEGHDGGDFYWGVLHILERYAADAHRRSVDIVTDQSCAITKTPKHRDA